MGMCCKKKTMIGWRNVWTIKWRVPGHEVDQRKLGERLWRKTVRHINWTERMPWIVIDGGSRLGMTDDHDWCEWMNVSSGTGSPRLSRAISKEPYIGCVCVCACVRVCVCWNHLFLEGWLVQNCYEVTCQQVNDSFLINKGWDIAPCMFAVWCSMHCLCWYEKNIHWLS